MRCENDWTVEIHGVNDGDPFEIRPVEMSLSMSRSEFDFCRAKFPVEVGEEMKPHTRYEGGALRNLKAADVLLDGQRVQRLLFMPDSVNYGNQYTHIEFHDLQKSMDDGIVDKQWETVSLYKAYKYCVDKVTNGLIDRPVFSVPQNQETVLVGEAGLDFNFNDDNADGKGFSIKEIREAGGYLNRWMFAGNVDDVEQNDTQKLADSYFAFDFNKVSPLKAIARLNKKFGLTTWTSTDGNLYVGFPEANPVHHLAAPNDERVWKYKDPNVTHPREPVKSVIVEGTWMDDPRYFDQVKDVVGWFTNNDGSGVGDVIATGYATRTDIDYGLTFSIKNKDAKRDALPHVARAALREKMKKQNTGTVEIDPQLSGEQVSELNHLTPGDLLHLVPNDRYFNNPGVDSGAIGTNYDIDDSCGGFVNNEVYLVTGVEHNVTEAGNWSVFADLGMYPDNPIKSTMFYFNPQSKEYLSEEDIFGGLLGGEDVVTETLEGQSEV